MKNLRQWFRLLPLGLALLVFAAQASAAEVNLYTTREPGLIQPLLDKFTAATGIKVKTVFVRDGLAERVAAEGRRSPADVLKVVDIGNLLDLVDRGVTQAVRSPALDSAIPAQLRDPEGHWYALSLRARVLYASKERTKITQIRYEDLASHYTKSRLPGVGISIGLTRLFWQLREAGLVEGIAESSVQAMVALMDETQLPEALDIARHLRAGGINTEVQMEARKVGKQFQYASRAGIRFVVLAGGDELARGVVAVKDLQREQQFEVPRDELPGTLRVELEQARALAGR